MTLTDLVTAAQSVDLFVWTNRGPSSCIVLTRDREATDKYKVKEIKLERPVGRGYWLSVEVEAND